MTLMEIEIYAKWKIDLKFNIFSLLYFASVHFYHRPSTNVKIKCGKTRIDISVNTVIGYES